MSSQLGKVRLLSLSEAQNHRCAYCHHHMSLGCGHLSQATVDHVVPISNGGSDRRLNLVAACYLCNSLKGAVRAEWFVAYINRLLQNPKLKEKWHRLTKPEIAVLSQTIITQYGNYQQKQRKVAPIHVSPPS